MNESNSKAWRYGAVCFLMAAAAAPALLIGFSTGPQQAAARTADGRVPSTASAANSAVKIRRPWEGAAAPKTPAPKAGDEPRVLVELFTSEGCSSCPPAEKVASSIARESPVKGARAHVIEWHVDYWDKLGWKDPYADKAYTGLQREYASVLAAGSASGDASVYTPQMIVNGTTGFVGSDGVRAKDEIRDAAARPLRMRIGDLKAERTPKGDLRVACTLGMNVNAVKPEPTPAKWPEGAKLWAVVVESGIVSKVTRGENEGKELHHDRVARAVASGPAREGANEITLSLPSGVNPTNAAVVVFVRDGESMRVLAVDEAEAPATKPEAVEEAKKSGAR